MKKLIATLLALPALIFAQTPAVQYNGSSGQMIAPVTLHVGTAAGKTIAVDSGGTISVASGGNFTLSSGANVSIGNGLITWAAVSKSGSSLADLTTRSASDLSSGTLPDARFPAILPALSGVNLTALNATQLTSGSVPLARLYTTLAGYGITDGVNAKVDDTNVTASISGHTLTLGWTGTLANSRLTNPSLTLGSTVLTLGTTTTTVAGLTSVTSTTFVGALTGNASTATLLANARNINGVSFNGGADITVTAAAGTLTGATLASNVLASSLTSLGTIAALSAGTGTFTGGISSTRTGGGAVLTGISTTSAGTYAAFGTNAANVAFVGSADQVYGGSVADAALGVNGANHLMLTTNGSVRLDISVSGVVFAGALSGITTLATTGDVTLSGTTGTSGHGYLSGPSAAGKFLTLRSGNATGGINFRDSAYNQVAQYYEGTDSWSFEKNVAVTGKLSSTRTVVDDNSVDFQNLSSTGYGPYLRGGAGSRYSLLVTKYDGTSLLNMSETNGLAVTGVATTTGHVGVGTTTPDIFSRGYGRILGVFGPTNSAIEINSATGYGAYFDMGVNGSRTFTLYSDTSSTDISTVGASRPITISPSGSIVGTFSSTGLAVTGITNLGQVPTDLMGTVNILYNGGSRNGLFIQDSSDSSGTYFTVYRNGSGTLIGSVTRVTTTNAIQVNLSSDERLKEHFGSFTGKAGKYIDMLEVDTWDWKVSDSVKSGKGFKPDDHKNSVGFRAQKIAKADPFFVHIGAVVVGDDDPLVVHEQWQRSDTALIPLLWGEARDNRARVASLEGRVAALEKKK